MNLVPFLVAAAAASAPAAARPPVPSPPPTTSPTTSRPDVHATGLPAGTSRRGEEPAIRCVFRGTILRVLPVDSVFDEVLARGECAQLGFGVDGEDGYRR